MLPSGCKRQCYGSQLLIDPSGSIETEGIHWKTLECAMFVIGQWDGLSVRIDDKGHGLMVDDSD